MTAIDDELGRIIKTLKDEGLYDKTIIIFTSDHGDLMGSHGRYGKQAPYDESIRVPLLVHFSGREAIKPGNYDGMFNYEDFMPTLLGLCGVTIPSSVEGKDYSGYLHGGANPKMGEGEDVADLICVQPFSSQWGRKSGGREFRGIRTPRYTYIRNLDGPWFLFDNQTDPFQMKNLVGDARSSGVQARLDGVLQKRLKEHGDQFLPGLEYVRLYHYPALDANGAVRYH
jgi:arylsulfatase A-like enzyme